MRNRSKFGWSLTCMNHLLSDFCKKNCYFITCINPYNEDIDNGRPPRLSQSIYAIFYITIKVLSVYKFVLFRK